MSMPAVSIALATCAISLALTTYLPTQRDSRDERQVIER